LSQTKERAANIGSVQFPSKQTNPPKRRFLWQLPAAGKQKCHSSPVTDGSYYLKKFMEQQYKQVKFL
jgi:hypothetical protein